MSKIRIYAVIAVAALLSGAAYAGPGRGGGGGGGHGGGGHFGGGGGAHFGGGGGAHFGGGGGMHFGGGHIGGGGGGMRFGGAHFGGARVGGAHFGGARIGGAHFGGVRIGRSGASHFAARPSSRGQRSFAVRGNANRAASRAAARVNRAAASNANRAATLGQNRNASFGPNRNANLQNRTANLRSTAAVQKALNSRAMVSGLQNKRGLVNPNTRAQLVATAATAGWLGGRNGRNAWWRHRHGGFGWVGPLFWPLAYYDIYDYALWGYGYDPLFWDYGYDDLYAGIFYPYGYDDLAAYMPSGGGYMASGGGGYGYGGTPQQASGQPSNARAAMPEQLAQLCGDDSRDIAGLPIDQIQQRLQLNDAQRAGLDDLANASVKAAQEIKNACPTKIPVTAPDRLGVMQQRIEAMIAAVQTVQPTLQRFYDLLNDEQRTQLNALVQDQRRLEAARNTNGSLAQSCGTAQSGISSSWPTAEIDARVRLNDAQRASFGALQQANAKAGELIKSSCPTTEPITPPARLEAVANRLNAMLEGVKTVRTALDDFYGNLNDEQRAQFEAIGPALGGVSNRPEDAQARAPRHRRHHGVSLNGVIRHFMSLARW